MKPSRGRFVRLLAALAAVTLIFGASASLAAGETAVTITGVSVAGKTYDGTPAEVARAWAASARSLQPLRLSRPVNASVCACTTRRRRICHADTAKSVR